MLKFDFHPENLLIAPLVAICPIQCEDPESESVHGVGLVVGWLFWTVGIGWVWKEL